MRRRKPVVCATEASVRGGDGVRERADGSEGGGCSPAYMAPEQLEGKDLTDKVDVWAYGVLLWEIATEQVPWASKGNSLDALKRSVCVK
eukprot:2428213-Rhodomonas_salina.1